MSSTPRQKPSPKKPAQEAIAAPPPADQAETFSRAIAALQARRYAEASALFAFAAEGPDRGMAHSARVHMRICERRMQSDGVELKSADDHYNYGVALLNERRLAEADRQLRAAIEKAPQGDHIHYALAICLALRGDLAGAYASLKRAIEIDPRNRIAARRDPDLAEFTRLSPIAELLYPGSTAA
ncbi:MAG: tetratricopeptide repeat protein [bacterium]|jgi:tetratricopeptide (TPR) repeat protein